MKIDHLIYGTLPDTPGSQHVIAKSERVSAPLETWLINYYDQFGDCRNEGFTKSLSVHGYREQPGDERVIITQVSHNGKDFSGRWGALLRHSAILTPEQYDSLGSRPNGIEKHLVSSGTSDQLTALTDLNIESANQGADWASSLLAANDFSFDDYRANLLALLKGQRLVLYAEGNTDQSNRYLRTLVSLLPRQCRQLLNWSEFVFRTSENLDLSLVYSSRHEAPADSKLTFAAVGENHIRELDLADGYAEEYLDRLSGALALKDTLQLTTLLTEQ